MTEGISIAFATGGFTVGGILITNLLNHLTTVNKNRKEKIQKINEERYSKVFSPIHKIIYFQKNTKKAMYEIAKIIYDNYSLATDNLKIEFKKCAQKNKLTKDFIDIIDIGCKCLESDLGYINKKLTKQEKKDNQKTIEELDDSADSIFKIIISAIIFASILVVSSLIYFIKEMLRNTELQELLYESINEIINLPALLVFIPLMALIPIILKTIKK